MDRSWYELCWSYQKVEGFLHTPQNAQRSMQLTHSVLIWAFSVVLRPSMFHNFVGYGKRRWRAWSITSGVSMVTFVSRSRSWPQYWLRWEHAWIPGHWHLCTNRKWDRVFHTGPFPYWTTLGGVAQWVWNIQGQIIVATLASLLSHNMSPMAMLVEKYWTNLQQFAKWSRYLQTSR